MCGLVSVVSKFTNGLTSRQADIFSTLLFIDTLRGNDSTGTFLIDNQGSLRLSKEASTAEVFMSHKDYDTLRTEAIKDGSALVGHNRKATKGIVIDANAHPFLVDDKICLVHNGTLWGDHKQHADVDVDSHAIAHLIAKEGVEKAISTINGAFALIWYNFEEETLNFIRNKERPLYFAETETEWVWASEPSMLEFVASRIGFTWKVPPTPLGEHIHVKYTLKDKSWELTDSEIKVLPKVYSSPAVTYPADACGYGEDDFGDGRFRRRAGWTNHDDMGYGYGTRRAGYTGYDKCDARARALIWGYGDTSVTKEEMDIGADFAILSTNDSFRGHFDKYHYNAKVECFTFDASCINGVDDSDGMYLWLVVSDDPSIVLRHRYAAGEVTQAYLEELAAAGVAYQCGIGSRAWVPCMPTRRTKDQVQLGFVLVACNGMTELKEDISEMKPKGDKVVH